MKYPIMAGRIWCFGTRRQIKFVKKFTRMTALFSPRVATFEEVATYVKEWKNTRLDICKGESEWVVTPSLSLDSQLFNHPLTLILNLNLGNRIKKAWQNGKRVSVRKWNEKYLLEFNPHGGSIRVKLK